MVAERILAIYKEWHLYDAIRKGLQQDRIKTYPIDLIGGFLYQDIVAVINILLTEPDPAVHDKVIRDGFTIFWNGIRVE